MRAIRNTTQLNTGEEMKKFTYNEIEKATHCGNNPCPFAGVDGCKPEHRAVVAARKNGAFYVASEVDEELNSKSGQLAAANTRILNLLAELAETNEKARVNGRLAVASQEDYRRERAARVESAENNVKLRDETVKLRRELSTQGVCIERLQRANDTFSEANNSLHRTLDGVRKELAETQRGVIGRHLDRDAYCVTGTRFLELEDAERERNNLRYSFGSATSELWKLRDQLSLSQAVRDSQGGIITKQRGELEAQRNRLRAQDRVITELTEETRRYRGACLIVPQGQKVVFIDSPMYASPLLQRIARALGVQEGEVAGDLAFRAQEIRDQRDSYKLIVKNIREALGMSEVSQGYAIIERAKQLTGSLKEVRRLAMSWLNIVPKRSDAAEYNHAVEVFRGIEKATNPPKPTTGENEAAQTTRAAAIGCCE